MLFRVRASLRDRPGALAELASRCGEAGLNILGLQIFPDLGVVTDELVISAPDSWTARAVAELVGGAGGDEVSVEPCTTHDLIDQPTRWLNAAAELVEDPHRLDELLETLVGPHPERWAGTEHSRAAALGDLARRLRSTGRDLSPRPAPRRDGPATTIEYAQSPSAIEAWIGRHAVGRADFGGPDGSEVTIEVEPAWRRLGIGTGLLNRSCRHAAERGLHEVVLLAPASDEGFVSMVCSAGVRARIKVDDGVLTARVAVSHLPRSRHGSAASRG